jgi:hypothetical protein
MDADDISLPQRLSLQRSFLEAHSEVVALGCQAELIDENGRPDGLFPGPVGNLSTKLALFRYQTPFLHPSAMFRRDAALAVGGYDESLACIQDRDFWWKLADRGKFYHLPDTLLRYRRHANQITTARRAEQVQLGIEITKRFGALYGFSTEELDSFSRVDLLAMARCHRSAEVSVDGLLRYVTVLNRILRLAADRWDADDVEIGRTRRERWRFLVRWHLINRPPAREWSCCLRTLHRLAPSEMRPDRLAGTLASEMVRRLPKVYRATVGMNP